MRVRENVSTPEDLLPSARQPAHGLGSLRYSLAVTHPGTNRGGRCLTSLIETNVVPLRHNVHGLRDWSQNKSWGWVEGDPSALTRDKTYHLLRYREEVVFSIFRLFLL